MFQIYTNPRRLKPLNDLALPHAIDKVLRDASKLSLRLCVNVYYYNFSEYRGIKKFTNVDFINERIEFLVMKDDRIAIYGAQHLSSVLPEEQALFYFKDFRLLDLPVNRDKTGLYYYETKQEFFIMKGR